MYTCALLFVPPCLYTGLVWGRGEASLAWVLGVDSRSGCGLETRGRGLSVGDSVDGGVAEERAEHY